MTPLMHHWRKLLAALVPGVLIIGIGLLSGSQLGSSPGPRPPTSTPVPTPTPFLSVTDIATGVDHTCAAIDDGTMRCWGDNVSGQLGDQQACGTTNCLAPVTVMANSAPLTGVLAVSTGDDFSCAALSGGARCWGKNNEDQVGALCGLAGQVDPCLDGVLVGNLFSAPSLSSGLSHTCVSTVQCWGSNILQRLGLGDNNNVNSKPFAWPVCANPSCTASFGGVSSLDVGDAHTCAVIAADGGVKCWGSDENMQLGLGKLDIFTPFSSPVSVCETGHYQFDCPPLTGVSAVAAAGTHTCALMQATGGVKCWGTRTGFGENGAGALPVDIAGLSSGVTAIAAGTNHACALMSDGTVKCFGDNSLGQLGDNQVCGMTTCSPATVANLNNVISIASNVDHTCAVKGDGTAWCWGTNGSGQLGDGTTDASLVPVKVVGFGP